MVLTSVAGLAQYAQDNSDLELGALCEVLEETLPKIRTSIGLEDLKDLQEVAFRCQRAATEVVIECRRHSFDAERLAGYIEHGDKDWIEHEVALVKLERSWLTIDLTAAQFPRFQEESLVLILCNPDWASLEAALQDSYSWWLPKQ